YSIALIITVLYLLLIPPFGFVGAAQALMVATGIHFLIVHFAAKRHYDMQLALRPLLLCFAVAFAASTVAAYLESPDLLTDIAIKCGIYLASCILVGGSLLSHPRVREIIARRMYRRAVPSSSSESA